MHHLIKDAGHILRAERPLSGKQFVEDRAQRKNVGTLVHFSSHGLLRRHVRRRAHHHAGLGHARVAQFGDAEIQNFDRALAGQHHVRGLQIAMDDPALVREPDGTADLIDIREHGPERQGPSAGHQFRERLALDKLHAQIEESVFFAYVIDGNDVGMVQISGGFGFLPQTFNVLFKIGGVAVE